MKATTPSADFSNGNCYLCQSSHFTARKGEVRDAPVMQTIECDHCGLVMLSGTDHIVPGFYENSGMHGAEPTPMDTWLKQTEWDDQRRFLHGKSHSSQDDFSRKPHPGMILKGQQELSIDVSRSLLFGDRLSDVQADTAAGVGTNLLLTTERPNEMGDLKHELITSLHEAIPYLQRGVQ